MSIIECDVNSGFKWTRVRTIDEMQAFYLSKLEGIRISAKACGYAIGLHGSTRRDLDLIAIPWVDQHTDKDALASAIQYAGSIGDQVHIEFQWEQKPCGRVATAFPVCWTEFYDMISAGHIDLSVMPPS